MSEDIAHHDSGGFTELQRALLGTQTIQPTADSDGPGIAEAWRTTATTSGTLGSLAIYVDSGNTATRLVAGLYTDAANKPGTLLAQGAINSPTSGAWNQVVPSAVVPSRAGKADSPTRAIRT